MEKTKTRSAKRIAETVKKFVNGVKPTGKPSCQAMLQCEDVQRRIREKAYYLYLESGCVNGHDAEHWQKAEKFVLAELKAGK